MNKSMDIPHFCTLDKTAEKVLLVVDDSQRLIGCLADGDIRRYILKRPGSNWHY
ncbi:MAG: hypothetical protein JRD93_20025 [Deltaproteobacteria bacterium]|nr:hypothetical protein [Deltaproteobacteria bacterium]